MIELHCVKNLVNFGPVTRV